MARIHLVHGFVGAGKTTFARRLAEERCAVRLSIDEWYLTLFDNGSHTHVDLAAWERLETLSLDHAIDVAAAGLASELYWVRCDDRTALERCLSRRGEVGSFDIDTATFAELRTRFEPLGADEPRLVVDTSDQST